MNKIDEVETREIKPNKLIVAQKRLLKIDFSD